MAHLVDEDTGLPTVSDSECPDALLRTLHVTIDGVQCDMDGLRFNTAIAKLIELNNALTKHVDAAAAHRGSLRATRADAESAVPHLASELWQRLGRSDEITYAPFPIADPNLLVSDTVEIPVQVNGKVRSRLTAPTGSSDDQLTALALSDEKVRIALQVPSHARSSWCPGGW